MTHGLTQSRSWIATIPAEGDKGISEAELLNVLESAKFSAVGQLEEGEKTGYRHWQLLLERESGAVIRFARLRVLFPTGHFEPRRGTIEQAMSYVTKTETRANPPVSISRGEIHRDQGKRTDLDQYYEAITGGKTAAQVVSEFPRAFRYARQLEALQSSLLIASPLAKEIRDDLKVYWVYGAPGVGKTRAVFSLGDIFRVSDYTRDPFGMYGGQDILVLDEYNGQLPYELFLQVTDVYPVELPCRYRNKPAIFTRLYILSNRSPWSVYGDTPDVDISAVLRRITGGVFQMVRDPDGARRLVQVPRDDREREQMQKNLADSPFPGFSVYPGNSPYSAAPEYPDKPF